MKNLLLFFIKPLTRWSWWRMSSWWWWWWWWEWWWWGLGDVLKNRDLKEMSFPSHFMKVSIWTKLSPSHIIWWSHLDLWWWDEKMVMMRWSSFHSSCSDSFSFSSDHSSKVVWKYDEHIITNKMTSKRTPLWLLNGPYSYEPYRSK